MIALDTSIVDKKAYESALHHLRELRVKLPRFEDLAHPPGLSPSAQAEMERLDPDEPHPLNLMRVHWLNGRDRRTRAAVPQYIRIPKIFSGVDAQILAARGDTFPLIGAHKVLAAYACLVPRLVTGRFDPAAHKAVWPSTGNYCRGGLAISRILGCRGVAVLPAGMSEERFRWLEKWVLDPADIIRTPGTESNVKEIYDACAELERASESNIILNQFSEYPNHLVHYHATGNALLNVFEAARQNSAGLKLRAFISATGSAGTIGAGDFLKERGGALIVAAEALECPTMLYNGFGSHNIQGIGDKHIPLIHNVMNTDVVAGISDAFTDSLYVLFQHPAGKEFLRNQIGMEENSINEMSSLGFSGFCNVLAAMKTARRKRFQEGDALVTMATDGASLYSTEMPKIIQSRFGGVFDEKSAARVWGRYVEGLSDDHLLELSQCDRERIFNLGYFTWVEQRQIPLADFEARRDQRFWQGLQKSIPVWDAMIDEFNARASF